jgi:putative membrane protein
MKIMNRCIGVLVGVSPLLFPGAALAWQGRGAVGWAPWSCGWTGAGGWQGWTGMILGIAFWILVCMSIVYLIRWISHNTRRDRVPLSAASGPAEILKTRYARGEITAEEFHRMRKELE